MSEDRWQDVTRERGEHSLLLGPNFAHQALHTPRHLLFVLSRYKFAARLLPQDRPVDVLELGCGEGLGTVMLSEGGHRVLGVDSDQAAVQQALNTVAKEGLTFLRDDFLGKRFGTFHAAVSLDVIEHIERDRERLFVETVLDNLEPGGFAVIGTPNETAWLYASRLSQVGHVNLFTAERLASLLRDYFQNVFMFGMNDEVVHTGFYPMCHYLFGVACGRR